MKVDQISGGYASGFKLENINFTIDEGKLYGLLGLNGSGKTTIIKMILGILKIKSGIVWIDHKDISKLKEKERAKLISYVPQYSNLTFNISVLDVVLMGITPYLKTFETPNKEQIKAAYESLQKFGIGDLSHKNYQNLSGGQKQMVMIARALLQNGKYMILDEPESNLDLVNKNIFMSKIREIVLSNNKGCLISMHHPEYALNYCDHILMLINGEIIEIDLMKEDIKQIEKKLSWIYGNIKIVPYKDKLLICYDEKAEGM